MFVIIKKNELEQISELSLLPSEPITRTPFCFLEGKRKEAVIMCVPGTGQNPPPGFFCALGGVLCLYHLSRCADRLENLALLLLMCSPFEGAKSLNIY